ncbi:putative pyrroloquinoline-quinone binding quinoprotein [Murinocardiopsis flavida]|uniref:Putative pyrroloquinoline-quinone binding quinoprotein n=1 Tax=Murinocardiopsis flavida TaxID=645275 RepID=A0A2P8CVG1_9ACTN|nr:PQQ-binding-like beta-propeller repeat protein [Murinocardiopsis flavida]PSK88936.1 putative pyrroloquinoline-quinone binding quinoprotein [Murinocardiopsis flavida]
MSRVRTVYWVGAVLAVAVVVAASIVALKVFAPAPEGAVAVGDTAQWSAKRQLGMAEVVGTELRGDSAVLVGSGADDLGTRLAVTDADSGALRWVFDSGMRIDSTAYLDEVGFPARHDTGGTAPPIIAESGGDWSVIVGYSVPAKDDQGDFDPTLDDVRERGIAALSVSDGTVQWKKKLPGHPRPLAADGGKVLVGATKSKDGTDKGPVTSYALDARREGRELWKHEGDWVYALAGDTALGEKSGPEYWEPGVDSVREGHALFALNAATGKRKWDLDGRYDGSALQGAVDGKAVVQVGSKEEGRSYTDTRGIVIDTETGRKAEGFGDLETDAGFFDCATDGRGLLACLDLGEPFLVTIRAGKRDKSMRAEVAGFGDDPEEVDLEAVGQGRIYLSGAEEGDGEEPKTRYTAVDRSGAELGDGFSGPVVAASKRHVAVRTGPEGGGGTVRVHRVAEGTEPPPAERPGRPEQPPLPVAKRPLWGLATGDEQPPAGKLKDVDLDRLYSVEMAAGQLLYSGETDNGTRFAALDPATGKQHWKIEGDRGLGGGAEISEFSGRELAGKDDELLLVEYSDGDSGGIAAVSVKDGDVRWKRPDAPGQRTFSHLATADETTFTVEVSTNEGDRTVEQRTEVYDLKTRRKLRTVAGTDPATQFDGTVVAERYDLPAKDLYRADPADIVAFDARSGKEKWALGDRYTDPRISRTAGGSALVLAHADGTAVLDPATGKELDGTPARLHNCSGSADPLLVCGVGEDESPNEAPFPATVEVADGRATIRLLPALSGHSQYRGFQEWAFAQYPRYEPEPGGAKTWGGHPGPFQMLDARGRPVGGGLPGAAIAADDDHVVLLAGRLGDWAGQDATLTVHRRG